ncbi:hypothetical protein BCD49_06660 [Pseudofrankia sp. EUN1h]|nr:hypothetical protein BCD49_06660 [Pseudofrankia sp. EUN1h]
MLALATALVAAVVVAGFSCRGLWAYHHARARATAQANGTITAVSSDGTIRLRWTDGAGVAHTRSVDVDGPRAVGEKIRIAYDPAAPARIFPADSGDTSAITRYYLELAGAVILAVLYSLVWTARLLRLRSTGQPGRPAAATLWSGKASMFSRSPGAGPSTWLRLIESPGSPHRGERELGWQRVMWNPALERLEPRTPVTLSGSMTTRSLLAITLPDGTRLLSIGRLRRRRPDWRWNLDRRPAADGRAFKHRRVVPALSWALLGATTGGVAVGLVSGHWMYAPLGVIVGAAYLVNAWALTGGAPRLPLL